MKTFPWSSFTVRAGRAKCLSPPGKSSGPMRHMLQVPSAWTSRCIVSPHLLGSFPGASGDILAEDPTDHLGEHLREGRSTRVQ